VFIFVSDALMEISISFFMSFAMLLRRLVVIIASEAGIDLSN